MKKRSIGLGIKKKNYNFILKLLKVLEKCILEVRLKKNFDIIITVKQKYYYFVILFLKKNINLQYNLLFDLTCTDNINNDKRFFEIIVSLLSLRFNNRILIKTVVNESILTSKIEEVYLDSITSIFKGADWLEREV